MVVLPHRELNPLLYLLHDSQKFFSSFVVEYYQSKIAKLAMVPAKIK